MFVRTATLLCVLLQSACGGSSPRQSTPAEAPAEDLSELPAPTEPGKSPSDCLVSFTAPMPIVAGAIELPPELVAARSKFFEAMKSRDGNARAAADAFIEAARAFRAVPDDSSFIEHAIQDAESCYKNAAASFARGGLMSSHGKGALQAEARIDQRMAERISAVLQEAPADRVPSGPLPQVPGHLMGG